MNKTDQYKTSRIHDNVVVYITTDMGCSTFLEKSNPLDVEFIIETNVDDDRDMRISIHSDRYVEYIQDVINRHPEYVSNGEIQVALRGTHNNYLMYNQPLKTLQKYNSNADIETES